ncbi:MAG: imidazole glycerol phosphate synthase subunit HisH [Candidatus Paceibacterota bacterium]
MKAAPRVQIIDYGLGNLFSIQQACHQVGMDPVVSSSPKDLAGANGIILPGVGAFGQAMDRLRELDFVEPLRETLRAGKPMLGICLGMQLLFDESEEFGTHAGLALLPGKIRRIPDQVEANRRLRVPNVGWNQVQLADGVQDREILQGVRNGSYMYFVHSFYADPTDPADWLLATEYGKIRYCCATQRDSILGVQFHPEKSGPLGLKLFDNWARTI